MIGDDITIVVVSLQGKKVRLGIEAPKHISVNREEVLQSISGDSKLDEEAQEDVVVI